MITRKMRLSMAMLNDCCECLDDRKYKKADEKDTTNETNTANGK